MALFPLLAAGALAGGLFSSRKGRQFLTGSPTRQGEIPYYTPEQESALNDLLNMGMSGLRNLSFDFSPYENIARTKFREETIPSLAERFSALNAQGSSSFKSALGRAASDLESQLAQMRSEYGLRSLPLLQNMVTMGLARRSTPYYEAGQPGFIQGVLSQPGTLRSLLSLLMAGRGL